MQKFKFEIQPGSLCMNDFAPGPMFYLWLCATFGDVHQLDYVVFIVVIWCNSFWFNVVCFGAIYVCSIRVPDKLPYGGAIKHIVSYPKSQHPKCIDESSLAP